MLTIGERRKAIGDQNRAAIREYFQTHLCATRRECAGALGLSPEAVGRHVAVIRSEWKGKKSRKQKG